MTGTVFLDDFDEGILRGIGADLYEVDRMPGDTEQAHMRFALRLDGTQKPTSIVVQGPPSYRGRVPVHFTIGSSSFTPKLFPSVVVNRTSVSEDFSQGGTWYTIDYKVPAAGGSVEAGGLMGPRFLEVKERATPFRIEYTVKIEDRGDRPARTSAAIMRFICARILPPGGKILVKDSAGDLRGYECLNTVNGDKSILDMISRSCIYTLTLTVKGELDFQDPVELPTGYTPVVGVSTR